MTPLCFKFIRIQLARLWKMCMVVNIRVKTYVKLTASMVSVLQNDSISCRVSSVLNKDVTQYGKMLMFDGKEDTCWCSESQSPQWVAIQWKNPASISSFHIQFQGGFVGSNCEIIMKDENEHQTVEPFYPEDNNTLQKFYLKSSHRMKKVTLKFSSSTDLFGRIIIYKLDILS